MAQKLNPFSGRQFLDANGDPYVGAKLFTYVAGSSTKTTTTKDSAGASAHANPIILNSRGEPGDGAGASQAIWQSEGVSVKLVLAPSTDTDPPVAAISTWDNLTGIGDAALIDQDQWSTGPTPTFVDATSFTLVGDQTTDFHIGRRLKTTNSGGTIYSTIIDSAYTTLTTVTVVNDSGSLDSGLSAVSYGLITSINNSIPGGFRHGIISWAKGADIASATALTLGKDGNYFDVTGTTAITSIDTVGVGTVIKLHFDGALTLTHHATDLILPDAANITTAAGDEAEFIEYAPGDWRLLNYQYATTPLINVADVDWANSRGLNTSSFSYGLAASRLTSTATTPFSVDVLNMYIPPNANKLYYKFRGYNSSAVLITYLRINTPTANGTQPEVTGTVNIWSNEGQVDVSADSGWTELTVQLWVSSASTGTLAALAFDFG